MLELLTGLYKNVRDPVIVLKGREVVYRNGAALQFGELTLPEEFCDLPVPFVGVLSVERTEYQAVASAAGEYRVFVLYRAENENRNIFSSLGTSLKDSVTTIRMASNAIKKNSNETGLQHYYNVMSHQIHSIDRIAGNMMFMAEGCRSSYGESIDLVELYGDLISSVNVLTKGSSAAVIFAPAVNDLMVTGDCNLLERMLLNLLSNSLKATPANGNIVVILERRGNRAMITVNDTGKGIPEHILSHLFNSASVERSLSESYHSIGMGLSIVQSIARSMGGTVMAKSEEGKGTMVTVSLPVSQENVFRTPSVRYGAKSMRLLQTELSEVLTADCYGEMFND